MSEKIAGINLSDYRAKKDSGLITLAKVGDAYALAVKAFDPETGKEIKPEVYGMAIEDLEKQKARLVKSTDNIQDLINDFKLIK